MSRPRLLLLSSAIGFVLTLGISTRAVEPGSGVATLPEGASLMTPSSARPAAQPTAAAQAQVPATAQAPPADYIGSDSCLGCHEDMNRGITGSPHGDPRHPGSPAAAQGCESCHGPGSRHLEDPADPAGIRRFTQMPARDVGETCLTCHTSSTHALWDGSAHDARNLSCVTCHSAHDPLAPAQLKAVSEVALCADCHRVQTNKMRRISHMPVADGTMTCSSCHNPHGSTNVRLLRTGNWINESCVSCHTEKRGPFLFEHAAGRESCVSCHDPHGSSNDRMLVARTPMLCQRCHIGTRHPSTIYDNLAVQSRSNRIIGRGCVNCHQQIHGSNHPSGQSLTR